MAVDRLGWGWSEVVLRPLHTLQALTWVIFSRHRSASRSSKRMSGKSGME